MAVLNIRNLPDDVHTELRVRAARAGRSMEAEAREILTEVVMGPAADPQRLKAWVRELYAGAPPTGVVDELIQERRTAAERE